MAYCDAIETQFRFLPRVLNLSHCIETEHIITTFSGSQLRIVCFWTIISHPKPGGLSAILCRLKLTSAGSSFCTTAICRTPKFKPRAILAVGFRSLFLGNF